jgi:hypothetical protein
MNSQGIPFKNIIIHFIFSYRRRGRGRGRKRRERGTLIPAPVGMELLAKLAAML